jgi:hypothetical protein
MEKMMNLDQVQNEINSNSDDDDKQCRNCEIEANKHCDECGGYGSNSDDDEIHICGETGREYDPDPGPEPGCGARCDDENGMIGNISYCVQCMEKYEPTGEMPHIFLNSEIPDECFCALDSCISCQVIMANAAAVDALSFYLVEKKLGL